MAKDYHFLCSKTIENAHAGQKNIMASAVFFPKNTDQKRSFLMFSNQISSERIQKNFR